MCCQYVPWCRKPVYLYIEIFFELCNKEIKIDFSIKKYISLQNQTKCNSIHLKQSILVFFWYKKCKLLLGSFRQCEGLAIHFEYPVQNNDFPLQYSFNIMSSVSRIRPRHLKKIQGSLSEGEGSIQLTSVY